MKKALGTFAVSVAVIATGVVVLPSTASAVTPSRTVTVIADEAPAPRAAIAGKKCAKVGKKKKVRGVTYVCTKVGKKKVWKKSGSTSPQGPAATIPPASAAGLWQAMMTNDDGSPVRWNPCSTITWSWTNGDEPNLSLMRTAVAELAGATGMTFAEVGSGARVPITYSSAPSAVGAIGLGGFSASGHGNFVIQSGTIDIDNDVRDNPGWYSTALKYEIFLHEWGHVIGLGHVDSNTEIMYPTANGQLGHYQAGDLAGLVAMGIQSGCLTLAA